MEQNYYDEDERYCRCSPCWCCYFKSCMSLRTGSMIIASIELMWNLAAMSLTAWIVLFYESNIQKAIRDGYATKEDRSWKGFMDVNGDGLKMLCGSYAIAAFMAFALLIHADKRKKQFTVWWLLVMPNVTGLQIAAIYFFPFPYTHANSAMVVIRLYFFWTVYRYARELFKYPHGLPKPSARAQPEVNEEMTGTGDKRGDSSNLDSQYLTESIASHQEGGNVAPFTESKMHHHNHHHQTGVSFGYVEIPPQEEHHHNPNDAHEHHIHSHSPSQQQYEHEGHHPNHHGHQHHNSVNPVYNHEHYDHVNNQQSESTHHHPHHHSSNQY